MNEHTKERYREKKRFKSIASDDWCFSNWAHSELRSSSLVTQKSGEKNAPQDVRNFNQQPAVYWNYYRTIIVYWWHAIQWMRSIRSKIDLKSRLLFTQPMSAPKSRCSWLAAINDQSMAILNEKNTHTTNHTHAIGTKRNEKKRNKCFADAAWASLEEKKFEIP